MKLQLALEELLKAVDAGAELPDALFRIAMKYKVDQGRLLEAYDGEFI